METLTLDNLLPTSASRLPAERCTYIGIDFGTSTTVVSLIEKIGSQIKASPLQINQQFQNGSIIQDSKIPTCLAYSKRFNELYVGAGAYESRFDPRLELGKNVWFEFKTLLGEDVGPRYSNTLLDGKEGRLKLETAVDATGIFLKNIKEEILKEIVHKGLSINIQWAVSVPASFEANQRKDLITALKYAGIENIGESMLIDEPNAAFLSYVDQSTRLPGHEPLIVPEGKPVSVLVFDFGAGTCDISILQFQQDDFSGVKSKNVAISHYTEIGGKDIDKVIADSLVKELYPIDPASPQVSELPGRVKERLSQQLLRIAEQLKVELCQQVTFHQKTKSGINFESLSSTIGISPDVKDHKGRVYHLKHLKLTYQQFSGIMESFTENQGTKSMLIPVKTALNSAGLNALETDYILFVGGSSKNPWIQNTLKTFFPDSEYLYPDDMQTLVSEGAAIHSYYLNGLKHKLIKPITGPSIQLRMANGLMRALVPSGTEIPFEGIEIDNLKPQRDNQEAIELPVCLTSDSHILQVLKIEPKDRSGFSFKDRIKLSVKITSDKTLYVAAKVSTGEAVVTQLNPYSSRALSTRERIAAEGRKKFNHAVSRNGGLASATAFVNLGQALSKAEERREAAEVMEEAYNLDSKSISLNNLAVAWDRAGDDKKACNFYRRAFNEGEVYAGVNLALKIRWSDPAEYSRLLNKSFSMQPNNEWVLFNYGQMLKSNGDEAWRLHWTVCLRIYLDRLESKSLNKDDAERALIIARALDMPLESSLIEEFISKLPADDLMFVEANTVTESNEVLVFPVSINQINN